jgi:hypothetical protein
MHWGASSIHDLISIGRCIDRPIYPYGRPINHEHVTPTTLIIS